MNVRIATVDDLDGVLRLYTQLHEGETFAADTQTKQVWHDILHDEKIYFLVGDLDGVLVSTCILTIIPNMTRQCRPYALIENVVSDNVYRKKGYGTAVLHKARDIAAQHNCYKVMLSTSNTDEATLNFYERAGFVRGTKTAFVMWLNR